MVPCSGDGDGDAVAVAEGGGGGGHAGGGDPGDGAAPRLQPWPHPPAQGPGGTACSVQGVQGLRSCHTGGGVANIFHV